MQRIVTVHIGPNVLHNHDGHLLAWLNLDGTQGPFPVSLADGSLSHFSAYERKVHQAIYIACATVPTARVCKLTERAEISHYRERLAR